MTSGYFYIVSECHKREGLLQVALDYLHHQGLGRGTTNINYSVIYKSASTESTEVATESLRAERVAFNKVFGVTAGFPSSSCFALQVLLACKYLDILDMIETLQGLSCACSLSHDMFI